MDKFDITNSEFALDKEPGTTVITSQNIIIGLGLLLMLGLAIYMYTYSNKKHVHFSENLDCEGGFCTMNNSKH